MADQYVPAKVGDRWFVAGYMKNSISGVVWSAALNKPAFEVADEKTAFMVASAMSSAYRIGSDNVRRLLREAIGGGDGDC